MDYNNYLDNFQNQLKKELIGNMDKGLAILDGLIANDVEKKNQLFNIMAQLGDLKNNMQEGTVSYENSTLQKNKIRSAVMSYIDDLQYDDMNKDSDYLTGNEEFAKYYEAYIATSKPSGEIIDAKEQPAPSSDLEMGFAGLEAASEDYIFLRFFPRIYREMRAHVFRRQAHDELLTLVYQNMDKMENLHSQHTAIVDGLPSLEKKNMELGRKIRRSLRNFNDLRSTMEQDSFDNLDKMEELMTKMENMMA